MGQSVSGARARIRAAMRRPRPITATQRWAGFLAATEPGLAVSPRVHRFAQVPLQAGPDAPALPLAAWIEGDGPAAQRTEDGLLAGTAAPITIMRGSLPDALAACRAERVLLLRAGDVPAPLALERLGQAAVLAPDAHVITADEDRLDLAGRRQQPHFRPGPSPDRWLACDDSGAAILVTREPAAALAGALSAEPGWRHELALGLAGPGGERAAHVPLLLLHRAAEGAGAAEPLSAAAVQRVLARSEPAARVENTADGVRHVRRDITGDPRLEVIVCLRDRAELLRRCVDTLLSTTAYERISLALVDNGSSEPATLELLRRYECDGRVRVLRDPRPFNFAALNNAAARTSAADVLVFLNNDTEIVNRDWVEPLLEEALRPEVGAVAPMLLFADGAIQHAGAALGLHGYAGHPFAGLRPGTETPFGRAGAGTRNWLAVTAACMMVQRSKFDAVGGFDERFIVAGNDVDLCLRLTAHGHRSLCVPQAVLVHHESSSRGTHIDPADFVRSELSYGEFRTVGDPFYNPNLTLDATDCSVRIATPEAR